MGVRGKVGRGREKGEGEGGWGHCQQGSIEAATVSLAR